MERYGTCKYFHSDSDTYLTSSAFKEVAVQYGLTLLQVVRKWLKVTG